MPTKPTEVTTAFIQFCVHFTNAVSLRDKGGDRERRTETERERERRKEKRGKLKRERRGSEPTRVKQL